MCIWLGYVCVVYSCYLYALSYLLWVDGCCSVSLLVSTSFAAAKLHHIAGQFILSTGEHSRSCLASTCHWYLPSPFFLFCLFSPFCRQPLDRLSQVWDDDVSKVTLPTWPGQGYGRHWLSLGLLVPFVSCLYSDVFDLLYDSDLCVVYLYSWLIGVVVVISVSCGLYCKPVVMLLLVVIPPASRACFDVYELLVGVSKIDIVRILAGSLESSWYWFWGVTSWYQSSGWRYPTGPFCL